MSEHIKATGLDLLREPFPEHQISKLPKPTKKQTDEVKADFKKGVRCQICGAWHHPEVVHLDYVGHAALTDRLLDADPHWTWEPMALHEGLPAFDSTGGLWIRLTVCGHTRIGYGHAAGSEYKDIGSREKEVIGDALRNAAMRFGAALDLWHKGDLHMDEPEPKKPPSGSAAEIKHDAYESLDVDGKAFIDNLALEVVDILGADGAPEAIKYINVKLQNTDLEWRNALWHRLDSKTRTALKAKTHGGGGFAGSHAEIGATGTNGLGELNP